jgi:cob(I)alamin adenosyltransferase
VDKDALRVEAYGTVDELNALLGLALAGGLAPQLAKPIPPLQNELFNLGADLAFPPEDRGELKLPQIEPRHIKQLESLIDELNDNLDPLENFVLPGGAPGAATLHVARTVCRRAERVLVHLARSETIGENNLPYLNRLSDLLFVMARYENMHRNVAEPIWDTSS